MPTGTINYLTPAASVVGTVDETTFYLQPVDPSQLVNGTNVVAVEIHQSGTNSSDIIFDLELSDSTFPPNQGPLANAGSDQTITLPASATLSGTVSDDGLPIPPGLGKPSSLTVPLSVALAGSVVVWSGPAFASGP